MPMWLWQFYRACRCGEEFSWKDFHRLPEFMVWLHCLNNRVIDDDACKFLKENFRVDVVPDTKMSRVRIPEEFEDEPRLKTALEEAAIANYARRTELEAKRHWRENVKRRRDELEEALAPPARRPRWDSDDDFATEAVPDYYEDCRPILLHSN
jgi:hypothetical protein